METTPTSIFVWWSGQRDSQKINFSDASNGGIDNFHSKQNYVCKCCDLIPVAIPVSSASPPIAFCPFLFQGGWQAWKLNDLEGYMQEPICTGFLEALTWAHCSNSFFSSSLHTAIHDCHVTLKYSVHSTFDTKSVAHCSPIGENPPTLFRSHFRYRYAYDMVPEWKVIDWSIV